MPLNLTSFTVGFFGAPFVSSLVGASFGPLNRRLDYSANALTPNLSPDPTIVIGLHHRGLARGEVAKFFLAHYGINFTPGEAPADLDWRGHLWRHYIEVSRPTLGSSQAKELYLQGWLPEERVRAALLHEGISHHLDVAAILESRTFLPVGEAVQAMLHGYIADADFDEVARRNGVAIPSNLAVWKAYRTPLAVEQIRARYLEGTFDVAAYVRELGMAGFARPGDIDRAAEVVTPHSPSVAQELYWRGVISADRYNGLLAHAGVRTAAQRGEFVRAQRPLPDPGLLYVMAVREVWDAEVVARYGLDADQPPEYATWVGAQGWGYDPSVDMPGAGQSRPSSLADLLWRASRQPIQPATALDALWRLRPGREDRYATVAPDLPPIEARDVEYALRAAGMPPLARRITAALSARQLEFRSMRLIYIRKVRDREWVKEHLIDARLLPDDAEAMLDRWDREERWERDRTVRGIAWSIEGAVIKEALAAYEGGLLSTQAATRVLTAQGLSPDNADKLLQLAISRKARKYVAGVIRALRRDFLLGATSPEEAAQLLLRGGITPEETTRLVQAWMLEKSLARRVQSSAWIQDKVRRGLLPNAAAAVRLRNLGWSEPDIVLALVSLQQDVAKAGARVQASADRARTAASRQVLAARKQAALVQKQARNQLRQLYPKADLKRWLREGIRSPRYVANLLRQQGYTPDYVDAFIADALYVKPTKPPISKATATQGPTPGTAGAGP